MGQGIKRSSLKRCIIKKNPQVKKHAIFYINRGRGTGFFRCGEQDNNFFREGIWVKNKCEKMIRERGGPILMDPHFQIFVKKLQKFFLFFISFRVRKCRVRKCRSAYVGPQESVRKSRSASANPQMSVRICRSASAGPQMSFSRIIQTH